MTGETLTKSLLRRIGSRLFPFDIVRLDLCMIFRQPRLDVVVIAVVVIASIWIFFPRVCILYRPELIGDLHPCVSPIAESRALGLPHRLKNIAYLTCGLRFLSFHTSYNHPWTVDRSARNLRTVLFR